MRIMLMKKLVCLLPLLIVSMTPAFADSGSLKVKTVKNMYNTAINTSRNGQDEDTLSTLFKYSDKNLQNAVALTRISRMNDDGDGLSECFSAYETLIINPSNGFSIDESENINYKLLNNGKVRASVKYTDDYTGVKDFSLSCNSSSCKVTDVFDVFDVFDVNGVSGRLNAEKLCR